MKAKTRITKKTLGWIAAAFLLAGMVSACKEAEGLIEDTKPKKENNGGRYTVSTSITPEDGGTFTATPDSNVAEDTTVSLKIDTAEGYRFVGLTVTGWTGIMTGSGSAYTFKMPAANVGLGAVFEAGEGAGTLHRVTIEQADGGAVDANLDYALAGAAVTLTATPDAGYKLFIEPTVAKESGGYVTVSGDGSYTFEMPEEDVTVRAGFTAAAASSAIPINNPASVAASGWTFTSPTVTITENGDYTITGTTTQNCVVVSSSVTARILLKDVSIDVSGETNACAFYITPDATVKLILAKDTTNTLKSNGQSAGLQVPDGATLVIASAAGAGNTNGTLNVYAGATGAGIGGGNGQIGGTIMINGGTVNTTSYNNNAGGAAIGGGSGAAGGSITILGGAVTAIGSANANAVGGGAGIGGGFQGDGGSITISGGTVTASTNSTDWGAAAIGGGGHNSNETANGGNAGTILISGGIVTATGGKHSAGIGSGYRARTGDANRSITINGTAQVTATGGHASAGIGGGCMSMSGTITIGGTAQVTATGGDRCPGIGSGFGSGAGSANNIFIYGTTYTGNASNKIEEYSRGNGEGKRINPDWAPDGRIITIDGSGLAKVIAKSGGNARVAIGEGDY